MDEKEYLTGSLFLYKNKLFYEEKGTEKEVKNHNWHRILKEYGWDKLHKQWIKKLNSYLKKPCNNSLWGCLECGAEGDCLFHCISYAFNSKYDKEYNANTLRIDISNSLTEDRYNELIEFYRIFKESGDFQEDWDPTEMTFDKFKELIIRGGDEYWGDFLIINLIKEFLNINLIVLNSNEFTNEYYNYPLFYEFNEHTDTLILLYEEGIHFRLVGKFNDGNMITLFTKENIPIEILKMINYLR